MRKERQPASRLAWVILIVVVLVTGGVAVWKNRSRNVVSAIAGSTDSAQSAKTNTTVSQTGKVVGVAGVQTSEGGQVAVDVRWDGRIVEQNDTETLTLQVAMNTHTVELNYDLTRLAALRDDQGEELRPKSWKAPAGGHHVSGLLTFEISEGFFADSSSLELMIRDVGGVPERLFRWKLIAAGSESAAGGVSEAWQRGNEGS